LRDPQGLAVPEDQASSHLDWLGAAGRLTPADTFHLT
jgi:hypothetical protein